VDAFSSPPVPLLLAEEIGKHYDPQPVLRGLTLRLEPGERLALMGPSGSGKSTLLHCLGGIETVDEGRILFRGENLADLDESARAALRRSAIGFVFQFFHLLPTLSARENIELPLEFAGVPAPERRQRVGELLAAVDMERRAAGTPSELSGGECQRIALARALAIRPRLLLADEPTGNLDSASGERVLDLLAELCTSAGTALIMVTHQPETTRICDRVLHMRDGQLVGEPAAAEE
jgi:ABC-type lipoprotein export system ATPase subunit